MTGNINEEDEELGILQEYLAHAQTDSLDLSEGDRNWLKRKIANCFSFDTEHMSTRGI